MRLALARLVDSRVRIVARPAEIANVSEQVSLSILHPQVAELRADCQKRRRRLSPGPTLDGQRSDQHKPTPVQHFVEYSLQARRESWKRTILLYLGNLIRGEMLDPIIATRELLAVPCRAILNLGRQVIHGPLPS